MCSPDPPESQTSLLFVFSIVNILESSNIFAVSPLLPVNLKFIGFPQDAECWVFASTTIGGVTVGVLQFVTVGVTFTDGVGETVGVVVGVEAETIDVPGTQDCTVGVKAGLRTVLGVGVLGTQQWLTEYVKRVS